MRLWDAESVSRIETTIRPQEPVRPLSAAYPAGRFVWFFQRGGTILSAAYPAGRTQIYTLECVCALSAAYPAGR